MARDRPTVSLRWRWDGINGMDASRLGRMQPWRRDSAFSVLAGSTLRDDGRRLRRGAVDLRNQGKSESALKTLCAVPGILPWPSKKAWENSTRWWYELRRVGRDCCFQLVRAPYIKFIWLPCFRDSHNFTCIYAYKHTPWSPMI